MNKTYIKNIFKDMKTTKGKVISILVMVALATIVIVALLLSGSSMRRTLDKALKEYDHPDLIVRSTYGLDYEDKVLLEKDSNIEEINFVKTSDLQTEDSIIRVKEYNPDIEKSIISQGDMLKNPKDLLLDDRLKESYQIGDEIIFTYLNEDQKEDDPMANMTYKVVGFFKSSDHIQEDMKEMSLMGKSELAGHAYVLAENFSTDKYGEANIVYKDLNQLPMTSDEYKKRVLEKKENLEDTIKNRPEEVLTSIREDANEKIEDAENELLDAERALDDGKDKLREAKAKLEDGFAKYEVNKKDFYRQIEDGKAKLESTRVDLVNGQNQLEEGKKTYQNNLADFEKKISDGKNQLDQKQKDLNAGLIDLDKGKKQIDEGYKKLNETYKLSSGKLDEAKASLMIAKEELDQKQDQLDQLKEALNPKDEEKEDKPSQKPSIDQENGKNDQKEGLIGEDNGKVKPVIPYDPVGDYEDMEANPGKDDLNSNPSDNLPNLDPNLDISKENIAKMEKELAEARKVYEESYKEYEANKKILDKTYSKQKNELDQKLGLLRANEEKLNQASLALEEAKNKLANQESVGRDQLNKAKADLDLNEEKINNGWNQYNMGLEELRASKARGENELAAGYNKLIDGQREYEENLKDFEKKEDDARGEIESGRKEIEESKDALLRLVDPDYTVESIFDNEGINTYYQNSLNMDKLAKVFPSFFYLVAMLVTLTTMKRYIDEQRTINGTLKSLGYSNKDIANRFYIYGLVPSLIGSILGAILGRFILLRVIFDAYSSGFIVGDMQVGNPIFVILISILISQVLIALTVKLSSKETVREVPANLLRGKAPKIGSKILLERISPIWNRLSFMAKITFRNLFRYKSRMFMTIFGVGGCTALIFFGFTMIDGVKDTVTLQQGEIFDYEVTAIKNTKASDEEITSYDEAIDEFENISIYNKSASLIKDGEEKDITIISPSDDKLIKDYISLREPRGEDLDLFTNKAIITEDIARRLGIKNGDEISFDIEDKEISIKIGGISENYVGDYLYISRPYLEDLLEDKLILNANLVKGDPDKIIEKMQDIKASAALVDNTGVYESMDVLMANLNLVITAITTMSAILAMVVLYNITSINVGERRRELATVKVLGFFPREVTAYIYREIFILTLIGISLGYLLGYTMFRYIISVVAPDGVMISYRVYPKSFIISAAITLVISLIILVFFHRRLKNIDMAEAMSSGE
ncbi:MAG: FtsX-like permease family protein [Anaerococcus sp.]|nr:FtsX-like permease family protein [Anaerococcus sp.]